jgi:hypothetical protein
MYRGGSCPVQQHSRPVTTWCRWVTEYNLDEFGSVMVVVRLRGWVEFR